jgi:hypothetical protein
MESMKLFPGILLATLFMFALHGVARAEALSDKSAVIEAADPQEVEVPEGLTPGQDEFISELPHVHLEADQIMLENGQTLAEFIAENKEWFDYLEREDAKRRGVGRY